MSSYTTQNKRQSLGLGFVPEEARHGFLIYVPRGTSQSDLISISEHRGADLEHLVSDEEGVNNPKPDSLRVLIDRARWLAIAGAFWDEANRRLRANGLLPQKFVKNPSKVVPVHPSLGKELCVLCWAVEDAPINDIPNAIQNWESLAPEERWWLYTMTVATTGQALQKGIGWRKALRAAIADNPFVKGEGMSPRSRRELLGHSQLSLSL